MSKRLMPTYLIKFLENLYNGNKPLDFTRVMVTRQFIAKLKELYVELGGKQPENYTQVLVPKYLQDFFNELEILEFDDDDISQTKTIPSNLVYPACRIDSIGGMSYKSENLFDKDTYNYSNKYYNGTGVLTSANDNSMHDEAIIILPNTQYTFSVNTAQAFLGVAFFNDNTFISKSQVTNTTSITFTTPNNCNKIYFNANYNSQAISADYLKTIEPMLNTGSTALPYEPYFEGIRDSAVTSVKSYDSNNNLIDTYTIPDEVQALDGWGVGINENCYNYLDLVNKKFIQKCKKHIITAQQQYLWVSGSYQFATINVGGDYKLGGINIYANNSNITKAEYASNGNIMFTFATAYESLEALKQAMIGVIIVYELATPVETNITENAPLLEVESGGTVVFENEYNNDVPSEVVTWIKEN